MTIEKLLTKLRADRDKLSATIEMLTPFVETPSTARRILAGVDEQVSTAKDEPARARKRKKLHWTQTPEGRALLSRKLKKFHRGLKRAANANG